MNPVNGKVVPTLVMVVGFVALLSVLGVYHTRLRGAESRVESMIQAIGRTRTVDRLMDQPIPAPVLEAINLESPTATEDGGVSGAFWVVDPAECGGCLSHLPEWSRMLEGTGLSGFVILSGYSETEADLLKTRYPLPSILGGLRSDPNASVQETLGLSLPSTKILVLEGRMVLVDTRWGGNCGWSFESVVRHFF